MNPLFDWLGPSLTPAAVASLLAAFSGAFVSALVAFHRLMRGKASRAELAEIKAEMRELASIVNKSTYDLAQALGSLTAVHRRLDEQGQMLAANTSATLDIARAVGARDNK